MLAISAKEMSPASNKNALDWMCYAPKALPHDEYQNASELVSIAKGNKTILLHLEGRHTD